MQCYFVLDGQQNMTLRIEKGKIWAVLKMIFLYINELHSVRIIYKTFGFGDYRTLPDIMNQLVKYSQRETIKIILANLREAECVRASNWFWFALGPMLTTNQPAKGLCTLATTGSFQPFVFFLCIYFLSYN